MSSHNFAKSKTTATSAFNVTSRKLIQLDIEADHVKAREGLLFKAHEEASMSQQRKRLSVPGMLSTKSNSNKAAGPFKNCSAT